MIIRTLDAGGDKPIPGLTPEGERNPFLGLRGLRLSLARPDVFRVQLRALARAAALGPLKVMAPMVSAPDEFAAFRRAVRGGAGRARGGRGRGRPAGARHDGRGAGRGLERRRLSQPISSRSAATI